MNVIFLELEKDLACLISFLTAPLELEVASFH